MVRAISKFALGPTYVFSLPSSALTFTAAPDPATAMGNPGTRNVFGVLSGAEGGSLALRFTTSPPMRMRTSEMKEAFEHVKPTARTLTSIFGTAVSEAENAGGTRHVLPNAREAEHFRFRLKLAFLRLMRRYE